MRKRKGAAGFTLMEAIIALAIWMVLSISAFLVWHHTSVRTAALLERQNALENARASMDILLVNLQMARAINLNVDQNYVLNNLTVSGYNAQNSPHNFTFYFITNPRSDRYRRLELGGPGNELASNIAMIRIMPVGNSHMNVTVKTGCEFPVILEGNVDIRYKRLTVNGVMR